MKNLLPSRHSLAANPLVGRDPFRNFQQEMDDLIAQFESEWNGDLTSGTITPTLDLTETEDAIQVRMDMPGIKPDDIDIEVSGNVVRISGERKEEKEEEGKTYHRVERHVGTFARALTLPCEINEDKIDAECREGVLTLQIPKAEQAKMKKIKVKP